MAHKLLGDNFKVCEFLAMLFIQLSHLCKVWARVSGDCIKFCFFMKFLYLCRKIQTYESRFKQRIGLPQAPLWETA